MDKYQLVLQIFAILFICYLFYLLIKFIIAFVKMKRLSIYSLDIKDDKIEKNFVFNIIFKFADFLKSLVIFNELGRTYNKYIYGDSRLRKGIDYVSIKILLGIFLMFIYTLICFLVRDNINPWIIGSTFILGFIIPDFYCMIAKTMKVKILNKNLLSAIIIMNNSYKANGSTDSAISDVVKRTDGIISLEFKKVLSDINLGMDASEAFYRMYIRTKLESVLYISRVLKVASKSSINMALAFSEIEKKLINEEKINNEIESIIKINRLALIVFTLLPLIFVVSFVLFNPLYIDVFTSNVGRFVFAIILILYLFYLVVIHHTFRGDKYGK